MDITSKGICGQRLSTLNSDTDFGSTTVKTHANVIQFSVGYAFIKD